MQYVGFALLGLTLILLLVALWQKMRMKAILSAPFRKTNEAGTNPGAADAKGVVSCEGNIGIIADLVAPCSQTPCVYYNIEVTRKWEEQVQTENGLKTKTGSDKFSTEWRGQRFRLNDGSGPVEVDVDEHVTGDLERSYKETQRAAFGRISFGGYQVDIPSSHGPRRTTGVTVVEKIIPAGGKLFVMGKLAGGVIRKKDGALGKLLLSTKGRTKLVGSTKRNMILALIFAVVALGPGVYFTITGKPPVDNCAGMTNATVGQCTGRISSAAGASHNWTVTQPGVYNFHVAGTGTDSMNRLWPKVIVTDMAGQSYLSKGETNGAPVSASVQFPAGIYRIHISDSAVADWGSRMHGGIGYALSISADPIDGPIPGLQGQPAQLPANPAVPTQPAQPAQPQPAPAPAQ